MNYSKIIDYIRKGYSLSQRYHSKDTESSFALPFPYTVPCIEKMFNNLFYWDTYFSNYGLILTDNPQQAKNNVDNLLYEVEQYGFVPNYNKKEGTYRTQQPYLSLMVNDIFDLYPDDTKWLDNATRVLEKEYDFWMTKRMTPIGLNRCFHHAPHEYLLSFYKYLKDNRFPQINHAKEEDKILFASHALAEAESWDFTPRYDRRCADFCLVDLNANLYLYEKNFAKYSKILKEGKENFWLDKAAQRKELINKYLWNDEKKLYYDYDFVNQQQSNMVTVAVFNMLMAGLADKQQAESILNKLNLLEMPFGISTCEKNDNEYTYQWDYPNGWPPMQLVTIKALDKYGFKEDAQRIARKYIQVVADSFEKTGHLWEKYNVETGTIDVKDEYDMPTMIGWTAGVFMYCLDYVEREV